MYDEGEKHCGTVVLLQCYGNQFESNGTLMLSAGSMCQR